MCFTLFHPKPGLTDSFAAQIISAELQSTPEGYNVQAEIGYQLSPNTKEALHKGVPLAWDVLIKISKIGWLFNTAVYEKRLPYVLQFHALLNQYEVKSPISQVEMFLSLNAALNYMAIVHDQLLIDPELMPPGNRYQLSVKTEFNREFLPVPLRPVAYLNSQWFLSSDWFIWPIPR
ncbi:DUF4390 domain-containing protein [Methylomonas paludis]|uniref:DUF4390 domain-containing protein n=1 Tax=Methylomonas paludis TaxID=1173101 RepID=UPI001FE625D8|nr:DUF4390 domain-containing protein [Methylomonas paludis]